MPPTPVVTRDQFDAVLFDLDGVLTPTASIHAQAWKGMFDPFLRDYAQRHDTPFAPFDIDRDYKRYVDGKTRQDGVRSFLESRHISLPWGQPDDPAERLTIHGLGQRKDALVNEVLRTRGVEPYPGSLKWLLQLRRGGFKTAVVSSSKNCQPVLQSAGIEALFDTRVDAVVAETQNLTGKPAPDMFLAAARQLGVRPSRAVVVEDALAGIEAGRRGGFALVIGVAREGEGAALQASGADHVVADLGELLSPDPSA